MRAAAGQADPVELAGLPGGPHSGARGAAAHLCLDDGHAEVIRKVRGAP